MAAVEGIVVVAVTVDGADIFSVGIDASATGAGAFATGITGCGVAG